MKFSLIYEGPLKSNGDAKHKQELRNEFDRQLAILWQTPELLNLRDYALGVKSASLVDAFEEALDIPGNPPKKVHPGWISQVKGQFFLPIVTSKIALFAELDIVWFRDQKPGQLLPKGDIDNRLKTLFDALQVPDENQMIAFSKETSQHAPFHTVLEDDALITRVGVETKRLLRNSNQNDVVLHIQVTTRVSNVTLENLNFV